MLRLNSTMVQFKSSILEATTVTLIVLSQFHYGSIQMYIEMIS